MSADLQELMASNDPMATPIMSVGPPPAMPTHPSNDGVQQQPIFRLCNRQSPLRNPNAKKKKSFMNSPELKDAFLVALIVFLVLMPSVQTTLLSHMHALEDKTLQGWLRLYCSGGVLFWETFRSKMLYVDPSEILNMILLYLQISCKIFILICIT